MAAESITVNFTAFAKCDACNREHDDTWDVDRERKELVCPKCGERYGEGELMRLITVKVGDE